MKTTTCFWCMILICVGSSLDASDWPMWRHDPARSGSTPEAVSSELHLQWSRDLGANHIAWGEDERIQFDASYEPIVVGKKLIVASARNHSVTAFNTDSGEVDWKFFVDAPVRLTPVGHEGRVYFGADDGRAYCLDITSGELIWKLDAAPSNRLVLGNDRLISVWPIRGGMVVDDDRLHFTAGVWPFEGTFLCSVNLNNNLDGTAPRIERHMLDELSPQGHLAIAGSNLLVPCGRANVSCLNIESFEPTSVTYESRGKTDYHVTSDGNRIFHGDAVIDSTTRTALPFKVNRAVSDGDMVYGTIEIVLEEQDKQVVTKLAAFDVAHPETVATIDRKGNPDSKLVIPQAWSMESDEITSDDEGTPRIFLKAGNHIFGHRGQTVFAANVSGDRPVIEWRHQFADQPTSMLSADGKLFVVTKDGQIHCFGANQAQPKQFELTAIPLAASGDFDGTNTKILQAAEEAGSGYCLSVGVGNESVLDEILNRTKMQVIVWDGDADNVAKLRRRWDASGVYGSRAFCINSTFGEATLPPYLASLLIVNDSDANTNIDEQTPAVFRVLRPYGGTAIFVAADATRETISKLAVELPEATVTTDDQLAIVKRPRAIPGAADWTHEYGDSGNTLMSQDELVRAPFGVLWFGGPASHGELFFNRHYWGPGLTVVDGRMFVQGPESLAAIDIYTGQVLWKKTLRTGHGPGRQGTFFELEKPGFHFTAASDAIYLVYPEKCVVLDPKTGEETSTLTLPSQLDQWGKVRVWNDQLIVTVFQDFAELGLIPRAVASVNRYTGVQKWTKEANLTNPLLAVGKDTVYTFDGYLQDFYDAWKRRGLVPKSEGARSLRAIDAETGETNWERPIEPVATWLAFSEEHNTLVVSNKAGVTAYRGDNGNERWTKAEEAPGFGGHPENVWDKVILSGDQIIDQRGPGRAFSIETGNEILQKDPITGQMIPWQFTKTGHHCNYAIASPHLLTFRAGTAGFFDRSSDSTGRLPGFRSGCRNSLIPAGGVLNAPNYAHGCVCSYNLFTSLALVHLPEADMWTYNALPSPKEQIQRLGVNLGAPGDRVSDDGTLWIEYPVADDPSASVPIEMTGEGIERFRLHPAEVDSEIVNNGEKWIVGCGVSGLTQLQIQIPKWTNSEASTYTVRLYFLEPNETTKPGDRIFDVSLQGETVINDLDIVSESHGPRRTLTREFAEVAIDNMLLIEFQSKMQTPILSGVEIFVEDAHE